MSTDIESISQKLGLAVRLLENAGEELENVHPDIAGRVNEIGEVIGHIQERLNR